MPTKSPAQARLMQAAAHTKGGYGGVPQSVGREFVAADRGSPKSREAHMAKRAKQAGQRGAAAEFGVSQSTISRRMARDGFQRKGGA